MPDNPAVHNAAVVSEIEEFFGALARREHEVRLEDIRGTVQIEIEPMPDGDGVLSEAPGDYWLLRLDRGDIGVSRERGAADCVLRTNEALFKQLARGEENAIAALLRGAMFVEGDLYLLITFERLLPSPPGTRDPRAQYQEAFR